jgi:glycosyltransferase involved in cell wall biosynthesis
VTQQLAAENTEQVKAIRFRHSGGKAAALAAGWKASRGDIVFTMDADLQDDPEEIPRFLEKMTEGFDGAFYGWFLISRDTDFEHLAEKVFAGEAIYRRQFNK